MSLPKLRRGARRSQRRLRFEQCEDRRVLSASTLTDLPLFDFREEAVWSFASEPQGSSVENAYLSVTVGSGLVWVDADSRLESVVSNSAERPLSFNAVDHYFLWGDGFTNDQPFNRFTPNADTSVTLNASGTYFSWGGPSTGDRFTDDADSGGRVETPDIGIADWFDGVTTEDLTDLDAAPKVPTGPSTGPTTGPSASQDPGAPAETEALSNEAAALFAVPLLSRFETLSRPSAEEESPGAGAVDLALLLETPNALQSPSILEENQLAERSDKHNPDRATRDAALAIEPWTRPVVWLAESSAATPETDGTAHRENLPSEPASAFSAKPIDPAESASKPTPAQSGQRDLSDTHEEVEAAEENRLAKPSDQQAVRVERQTSWGYRWASAIVTSLSFGSLVWARRTTKHEQLPPLPSRRAGSRR